jgi:hypothetical protein
MSFLSAEIQRLRGSVLARNAGWILVGQGLNLVVQAAGSAIALWRALAEGLRRARKGRKRREQFNVLAKSFGRA